MKKIIAGAMLVLGVASVVPTAFGQGFVAFSSYFANNGGGALTTSLLGGAPVGSTFSANLFFALGTVSDPNGGQGTDTGNILLPGGSFQLVTGANSLQAYASDGYFGQTPQQVTIPGYTSGSVSFEVVAWAGGTSYGDPNNVFRGRSAVFTMNSIALAGNPVPGLGDNGQPMPAFNVSPVPEPSTLALAGLGLASLVVFRRRK